ncbi:eukaryotic translation initiation factor 3 subunit C [Trifolium medium]|uniref:Eukaryotic translation initiation factor 3 subunit C n=1 Tax=Trifolium medium TaxID=97028 RepID=A0A392Q2C8_9FABA|nr:eukaryotic translation initiation factor 3 subunit C [Trifolium medium]
MQIRNQQNMQLTTYATWVKPQDGWIKCNVDAELFESQGITTVACCIRNNNNEFQCAQTRQFNSRFSIVEGEGMTMLEAIQLAIHHGWNFVISKF